LKPRDRYAFLKLYESPLNNELDNKISNTSGPERAIKSAAIVLVVVTLITMLIVMLVITVTPVVLLADL